VAALRVKDAAETRGALEVAVHPRARVCGRLESSDVGGQAQHAYESLTRNRHSTRSSSRPCFTPLHIVHDRSIVYEGLYI